VFSWSLQSADLSEGGTHLLTMVHTFHFTHPMFALPVSHTGILDHLVVIHSSWGAELGGAGDCLANEQPDRIWSQGSAANNGDGIKLQSGNFNVGGYTIGSSMGARVCTKEPAKLGIITHEYLHGFKLVDLYDQDIDDGPISIGGAG
jgi:M6 family metalloprotease-like protein